MENQASPWSSSRMPFQEQNGSCYPDSPPADKLHVDSDDLVDTSHLHPNDDDEQQRVDMVLSAHHQQQQRRPIILLGGTEPITIGRGSDATIKIGKRNRQISRIHARIELKPENKWYEFVVVGLNGAMVDNVLYRQHERTELVDGANINILGSKITFMYPDMAMLFRSEDEIQRPLSPHPSTPKEGEREKPQQQQDEEAMPVKEEEQRAELQEQVKEQQESATSMTPNADKEDGKLTDVQQPAATTTTTTTTAAETSIPSDAGMDNDDVESSPSQPTVDVKMEDETPAQDAKRKANDEDDDDKENGDNIDVAEVIIDALVFSRKSSMPISDICSRIMSTHPTYRTEGREVWKARVQKVLKEKPFFGEIVRKGKTADGSPKENLYYYNSEADPVEWRRAEYTHVGRSARKCTLQDKQYFWKIPPKLGRNRHSYVPPPSKAYEQEKKDAKKQKTMGAVDINSV